MNSFLQRLRSSALAAGINCLFIALVSIAALSGCSGDKTTNIVQSTVASLNVSINPASATVVVTGPDGFSKTFTGNQFLTDLKPGQYTARATAPGFADDSASINVVTGQTSSISLILKATEVISGTPRAVYRDSQGSLIPLVAGNLQSGQYIFYAWLENQAAGVDPAKVASGSASDPGKPLVAEQTETAPSFTQNLAGAWVGFKDAAGVVHPVVGADVRWEIDQQYAARVGSMQFGTSDDNRVAIGYGVSDDQADTRTNNARLDGERFPLIASEYPLYNQTGVVTPFVDGFTWVTLFSPDAKASGRIVAVATVNGEEIGKQILHKNFAPSPRIEITKTVNTSLVNLVGGTGTATWNVTVKNTGLGDAAAVNLSDVLQSGVGPNYTLSGLPAGSTPVGDGFTHSFPLLAGATVTFPLTATVTAPGTYCNEGQITSYRAGTSTTNPADLKAKACFTAVSPILSIIKDFVDADGTTSLGSAVTAAANQSVKLRIQVINSGTGTASAVAVTDALTAGTLANYTLTSVSPAVPVVGGGFNSYSLGNLAPGASATPLIFTVKASSDGTYCDTATITGGAADSVCLTVATPILAITKTHSQAGVIPGSSYTSTIVVRNTGTATAKNVVISDLLGLNAAANVQTVYVSSSMNGASGTLANNTVTANTIDILPGASVTYTVVSRIPLAAASGDYCDTATVTSSNAATRNANACVNVPAFSALQTQLVDLTDPIVVGNSSTYASVLYVEALSNEGVNNNSLTFIFGHAAATDLVTPGVFDVTSTKVYLDSRPVRDPTTGLVVSDAGNATAVLQVLGTNYTVATDPSNGKQVITMTPGVELQPNTALYVVNTVTVPAGTASGMYTTSYIWNSKGTGTIPQNSYQASASEPTTVIR